MVILDQIIKRKKIVITTAIAAFFIGGLFSLLIKPTYKATVEIAMKPTEVLEGFSSDVKASSEYLKHQIDIMQSDKVVEGAIEKLHLKMSDVLNENNLKASFLKHIEIKAVGNSLVKITAKADRPQLAAGMASQLASSFMELNKQNSISISKDAMDWLSESGKLGKDLKESESKILNFIKENNMQNPQQQLENYTEDTDKLIKEKAQLVVLLKENKYILDKLTPLVTGKNTEEILSGQLDPYLMPILGDYWREYSEIQSKVDELLKTYKDDHPQVITLNERKQSIIKQADSKISGALKLSKDNVDYAGKRITELETEIEKGRKDYSDLLTKKREFDLLKVKYDNLDSLCKKIKDKLESGDMSLVSVSMIGFSEANGAAPVTQYRPTGNFLIFFTLCGFIIGILMALFLERSTMKKTI